MEAVVTANLSRLIQQALAPLHEELVRIRILLERLDAVRTIPRAELPERDARGVETVIRDPSAVAGESAAPETPAHAPSPFEPPEYVTPHAAASFTAALVEDPLPPVSSRDSRPAATVPPEAAEVELLSQLLADYPDDAAAVYFGFDRQQRCAPERLDRLARQSGLEEPWHAANRATIRFLTERHHGGLHMVAELIGRDSDSLHALLKRIGLRDWVENVRARERDRLRQAPLAVRLGQLLFREKMLSDLGIRMEMDTRVRQELRDRCAALSGECEDGAQVFERLGQECNLDDNGVARMLRRYELIPFVADLYHEPARLDRPAPRRTRQESRPPLDDAEIEARILQMLLAKRKVGAAHTHIDHLVRTVPPHERGRARAIIDRLLHDGSLTRKVTDNSAEPHVSIAVAAMPAIEQRLRPRLRADAARRTAAVES